MMDANNNSTLWKDIYTFQRNHAKYPSSIIKTLEPRVRNDAKYFLNEFQHSFAPCVGYTRVGSVEDETRVEGSNVEFDLFYTVPYMGYNDLYLQPLIGRPGFYFISDWYGALNARRFSNHFYRICKNVVDSSKRYINIQRRGLTSNLLTIQDGNLTYQLDLIPGIVTWNNLCFVPRQFRNKRNEIRYAWFRTYSVEECYFLNQFSMQDPRKICLRTLKAIRNSDDTLRSHLEVPLIKNVVMKHVRRKDWDMSRGEEELVGRRVYAGLQALRTGFSTQKIAKYRNPRFNMMDTYKNREYKITKVKERLDSLLDEEGSLKALLLK